jgi:hypothetical protein
VWAPSVISTSPASASDASRAVTLTESPSAVKSATVESEPDGADVRDPCVDAGADRNETGRGAQQVGRGLDRLACVVRADGGHVERDNLGRDDSGASPPSRTVIMSEWSSRADDDREPARNPRSE